MRGTVFGTPGYLPPEALLGKGFDASSDLFSLGAVAFYCLTGRPAFRGRTSADILANTLHASVPSLRELCRDAPPELEAIVAGLLERDPQRRIADAALLTTELARMSESRGWRWTLPGPADARPPAEVTMQDSGVTHAQVLDTMKAQTQPED
jgi:serine/threonine protein kinase